MVLALIVGMSTRNDLKVYHLSKDSAFDGADRSHVLPSIFPVLPGRSSEVALGQSAEHVGHCKRLFIGRYRGTKELRTLKVSIATAALRGARELPSLGVRERHGAVPAEKHAGRKACVGLLRLGGCVQQQRC